MKKVNATASKDTKGQNKFKEEFRVDTNISEGKNDNKNDTNVSVTAKLSGFAGFSAPVGRTNGYLLRRHLPSTLDTREGVGGQAEGTR